MKHIIIYFDNGDEIQVDKIEFISDNKLIYTTEDGEYTVRLDEIIDIFIDLQS